MIQKRESMHRWNNKTLEYEEYTVPDDWKVKTVSIDMNEKVNCAACGHVMKCGDGFTSRTIHDEIGFGYMVCYECYRKEIEEEKVSLHIVQRSLIESMNKYCEEKFDLSYPRTRDEASYYVKKHIDEYLNKSLYDN